ncbi:hypothetical protein V8B55DRAFT_1152884 [Mucor lusitanicus]
MLIKTSLISAAFVSVATASTCLWSSRCYGTAYGAGYVCSQEYPDGGRATGKSRACDGFAMRAYECCGITKTLSDECQWSYCAGLTISGQATCNDYGSDWKYSGSYSGSDCGFFSSNVKVKCCKEKFY